MFALINIYTGKVCAAKETKNELIRLAVSTENVRSIVRGDYTLHNMSVSEAWDKLISKIYRIESIGF